MKQSILPKSTQDGVEYLSPSQVKEFLTCGARYEFRYVQGLPEPWGIDAIYGSAVHAGLETVFKGWGSKDVQSLSERLGEIVPSIFMGKLDEAIEKNAVREHDASSATLELGYEAARLARLMFDSIVGKILSPIHVEREVTRDMGGYLSRGFADLEAQVDVPPPKTEDTPDVWLIDYKTTKRTPPEGQASREHSLQLLAYGNNIIGGPANHGVPAMDSIEKIWVVYGVRNKTPKVEWRQVPYTTASLEWADTVLRSAYEGIRLKQFAPNPIGAGFICDPKYCGYWSRCIGAPKHEEVQ